MIKKVQIFCLVLWILSIQFIGFGADRMIIPIPEIQTQINQIVLLGKTGAQREKIPDEIAKLKQMGTIECLLQQLIYFRTNTMKIYNEKRISSDEMEIAMNMALYIIGNFLKPADNSFEKIASESAQDLIRAVFPYLDTEDTELKSQLYRMLKMVDLNVSGKQIHPKYSEYPVDYTEYKKFIETSKEKIEPLIQYMYERAPGDALITLSQVYIKDPDEREKIINEEKIIREDFQKRYSGSLESRHSVSEQAKKAINQLSMYPQWWIQLYVAEIIYREPRFKDSQILERIKSTNHPLVLKSLGKGDEK